MDTKIGFHFNNANASLKIDGHQVDLAGPKDTKEVIGKDGRLKTIEGFVAQDGTFFQVKEGKTGGIDIIVRGTPEQLASYDFGVKNGSVSSARYGENSYRPGGPVAASDFTIKSGTSGEEILSEHGMVEKLPRVMIAPGSIKTDANGHLIQGLNDGLIEDHFSSSGNPPNREVSFQEEAQPEVHQYIPEWERNGGSNGASSRADVYEYPRPSAPDDGKPGEPAANEAQPDATKPQKDPKIYEYDGSEAIARAQAGKNGKADVENPASDFVVSGNPGSARIIENLEPGKRAPADSVDASSAIEAEAAVTMLEPEVKGQLAQLRERIANLPEELPGADLTDILDDAINRHATERWAIAGLKKPVIESYFKASREYKELKQTQNSAISELIAMVKDKLGKPNKPADLGLQQSKTAEIKDLTARLQESGEKLIPLKKDAQNLLARRDRNERNLVSVMDLVSNRLDELGVQNPTMVPGNIEIRENYFANPAVEPGGVQKSQRQEARAEKDNSKEQSIDPFAPDSSEVDSTGMATELKEKGLDESLLNESDFQVSGSDLRELEQIESRISRMTEENDDWIREELPELFTKELDENASQPLSAAELFRSAFPEQMAKIDRRKNPS